MKMNVLKTNPTLGILALVLSGTIGVQAQNAAAPLSDFSAPSYRGQAGTESAFWNTNFTVAYNGPNPTSAVAPGGSTLADATITQTKPLTYGQIVSGGIYTGSTVGNFDLNYSLSDTAAFPNGIGNVLFQTETTGYQLNYNAVTLSYTTASGTETLSPISSTQTFDTGSLGTMVSADVVSDWEWNLPLSDDVTSFSIDFAGSTSHVDLGNAMLDVASFDVTPTPEPSTLALASTGGLAGFFIFRRRK
jgi:hypothetical protein